MTTRIIRRDWFSSDPINMSSPTQVLIYNYAQKPIWPELTQYFSLEEAVGRSFSPIENLTLSWFNIRCVVILKKHYVRRQCVGWYWACRDLKCPVFRVHFGENDWSNLIKLRVLVLFTGVKEDKPLMQWWGMEWNSVVRVCLSVSPINEQCSSPRHARSSRTNTSQIL